MKKDFRITLSNFELKKDGNKPEVFGVYLIIDKRGQLSAGCWTEGTEYPNGAFRQSRGGSIDLENVIAWIDLEKERIDVTELLGKGEENYGERK